MNLRGTGVDLPSCSQEIQPEHWVVVAGGTTSKGTRQGVSLIENRSRTSRADRANKADKG